MLEADDDDDGNIIHVRASYIIFLAMLHTKISPLFTIIIMLVIRATEWKQSQVFLLIREGSLLFFSHVLFLLFSILFFFYYLSKPIKFKWKYPF